MLAIPFNGSQSIGKPESMTDEQCSSLEVMVGVDVENVPYFLSCWQPSKEDIEAVVAGRPVWLKICGVGHPPVSLFTTNEAGDCN